MTRRLRNAVALTSLALVALTGCFKADYDMSVDGDTVSGTFIVATDKSFADGVEGGGEASVDSFDIDEEKLAEFGAKAEAEPYEDDRFVGEKVTFSDVPIDKIDLFFAGDDAPTADDEFTISRDGDQYSFVMRAGVEEPLGDDEFSGMFDAMMATAEVKVAIALPGEIVDTNGTVDGSTVSWDLDVTESIDIYASSDAAGVTEDTAISLVSVVGGLVLLLIVAAGAFVFTKRGRGETGEGDEATDTFNRNHDDELDMAEADTEMIPVVTQQQPVQKFQPGWYPTADPQVLRYHDGTDWTEHTHQA